MTPTEADARAWRAWYDDVTCWHECGHALCQALCLGEPPELVSTRPGERYHGVTIGAPLKSRLDTSVMTGAPLPLEHPSVRAFLERRIMIDLAGGIAAGFGKPWEGAGYTEDDEHDERVARERAEALMRQSPRHRELLAEAEASFDDESDEDHARRMSAVYVRPEAITHHIEWLRYETRAMIVAHRAQLVALHAALSERHVLTGPEVDAALVGTECDCHRWTS